MYRFLIPFVAFLSSAQALVLEDLVKENKLTELLSHRKIGYYIGSFDPLHFGHQDTIQVSLDKGLVDYVIVYPNWGGDNYKQRLPIEQRLKMVFAAYKDDPRVIVSALPPQEMQKHLKIPAEFIGIMGTDTAFKLAIPMEDQQQDRERIKHLNIFMKGVQVPDKYAKHSIGGIMAIPVESFIVAIREEDDVSPLEEMIGDRPILATITTNHPGISSTGVKQAIKQNESIHEMVDPEVLKVIQENRLYQ
jgi:cytidyltransferase-like protein